VLPTTSVDSHSATGRDRSGRSDAVVEGHHLHWIDGVVPGDAVILEAMVRNIGPANNPGPASGVLVRSSELRWRGSTSEVASV